MFLWRGQRASRCSDGARGGWRGINAVWASRFVLAGGMGALAVGGRRGSADAHVARGRPRGVVARWALGWRREDGGWATGQASLLFWATLHHLRSRYPSHLPSRSFCPYACLLSASLASSRFHLFYYLLPLLRAGMPAMRWPAKSAALT